MESSSDGKCVKETRPRELNSCKPETREGGRAEVDDGQARGSKEAVNTRRAKGAELGR